MRSCCRWSSNVCATRAAVHNPPPKSQVDAIGRALRTFVSPVMQQSILIILHQEHSTPGRVGNALRELGYRLAVRRPRFGDPLPKNMADHSAGIIFGGPMSANDQDDFIRREIDWTAVPLRDNKPYLGICLGAQMFARQLGGKVFRHPEGRAEIGYYPIRPTAAGLPLRQPRAGNVYQLPPQGFYPPRGAPLVA